jgi:hypothetical protein
MRANILSLEASKSDEACSRGSRIQGKEEQRESETQGEGVGKKWWSVYRRVVLTSKSEGCQ